MFHTNKKSEADKTAKLIKNALSKNITNTETAVDVNFSSCPTLASKHSIPVPVFHLHRPLI